MNNEQTPESPITLVDHSTIEYPWHELLNSSIKSVSVFVYGSLVNLESAARSLHFSPLVLKYAIAKGVKRVFNYKMPPRFLEAWGVDAEGNQQAALNLVLTGNEKDFVNGAIIDIDRRDFSHLLLREEGYDLVRVECSPWSKEAECPELVYAFAARSTTAHGRKCLDFSIDPVPGYLDLVVNSHSSVSVEFARFFRRTTFLNCGKSLEDRFN